MSSLPPVKSSLAALAQKSVSRPVPSARPEQTGGSRAPNPGPGPGGGVKADGAFSPIDLPQAKSVPSFTQTAKSNPAAATQNVETPSARAARSDVPASTSNKPQTFTLQTLSAMTAVIVSQLDGGGGGTETPLAPGHGGPSVGGGALSSAEEASSPSAESNSPSEKARRPGSRLNVSV